MKQPFGCPGFRAAAGAAALALILPACSHSRPRGPGAPVSVHAPRLILVSIDGLRPAFYLKPEYRAAAPTLARMSDEAERAPEGIEPVFPTVTYPNHTAMVTGAYSAHSGIYSNQIYSPKLGLLDDWNFYANEIKSPTLWDAAEGSRLKTAIIRWPAATGARVDWDFPEIFYPGAFDIPRDWTLIEQHTEPRSFLTGIENEGPLRHPSVFGDLDEMGYQAFAYLMKHADPDLILIHLSNLDYVQHQFGTDSPEVVRAAAGIDGILARMMKWIDPSKTTVIVTGDHGFASYRDILYIAPLIRAAGVEKRVLGLADGGQSAIYQLPGGEKASARDCVKILQASRKYGRLLTLISRRRLNELHAYPGALCALEARLGSVISGKASAQVLRHLASPRGHHGYLPSRPQMRAGFFIWGRGARPGRLAGDADGRFIMPDIAPTAASILGIPYQAPDGTAIHL